MKIWKFWRKVVGRQIILAANQTYKELLKKGKVGRKNLFRWVNLSANELYMRGAGGPKLEAALGRSPICGFANSQPQTHRPQPSQRMNETKRWWRWTDTHREFIILGDQFQSGSFWKVNCNIVCKFFSWKTSTLYLASLHLEVIYAAVFHWMYWQGGDFPFLWLCHG